MGSPVWQPPAPGRYGLVWEGWVYDARIEASA
jgi:hypothetical protein